MLYKCILYKFEEDGRKTMASVPLRFQDTSLDDVYYHCSQLRFKGWQFADIEVYDGKYWHFIGVFYLLGGLYNG